MRSWVTGVGGWWGREGLWFRVSIARYWVVGAGCRRVVGMVQFGGGR